MSLNNLNWNAFLTDEGLNLPNDQWSDLPSTSACYSDMPSTSGAPRAVAIEATGSSNFHSSLNGTVGDQYLDENYFNPDYFLGELEVLQPFGDSIAGEGSTSESSPEDTTRLAYMGYAGFDQANSDMSTASQTPGSASSASRQPPRMPSFTNLVSLNREPPRHQTYPNRTYESMFSNNIDSGFVEDLTFPNAPNGLSQTIENTSQPVAPTTTKRNKGQPDSLSACWTSPLCPNHDKDGPAPNPSTCGGGCAPFLFASEDSISSTAVNGNPPDDVSEEGVVEIKSSRSRKRSEGEVSTDEPTTGRQFPSKTTTTPTTETQLKTETPQDSPDQTSPQQNTEDDKAKPGRRRLPHNQVERKYRESLNTQLDSLRRVVPSLQQNLQSFDRPDIEDLPTPPSKPSKAVVLASATAYIKQMEKDKRELEKRNELLERRVKALQQLVKCDDCSLMQYVMDLKIQPQCQVGR
ncbi:hypothetical protein GQ43DRAFT_444021 [Delitschia confertaspora ATCC 74209]|uniref:BHLH domain-containing protein n=1 Tax=Delitschia confertaspora ATCC 74209 TaxID=1513339 RepID=A0A9P4JJK7_9PLEO|nr:hypothetical protein GQ43DRAFT_444021 [Delitschia confertaspora ATCC 74209]